MAFLKNIVICITLLSTTLGVPSLLLAESGFQGVTVKPVRTKDEIRSFSKKYPEISKSLVHAFTIPGLTEYYVPQGISWFTFPKLGIEDGYIISMYYKGTESNKVPSLFVIMSAAGKIRKIAKLYSSDNTPFYEHVGGITVTHGKLAMNIWTVSSGKLYRFNAYHLLNSSEIQRLTADKIYEIDSKGSFISSNNDYLWIGDFSHGKKYKTPQHHHAKGKKAWIAGYHINIDTGLLTSNIKYKINGNYVLKPDKVLFTRQMVQGMAICGNKIALSISYGSNNSKLAIYKSPINNTGFTVKLPDNHSTNGFLLNSTNHLTTIIIPPGSEDLEWNGKYLLTAFEGGAMPYKKRWRKKGGYIEDRLYILKLPNVLKKQ